VTDAATLEEPNTVIIQQNYEVFLAVIVKRGVLGHYVTENLWCSKRATFFLAQGEGPVVIEGFEEIIVVPMNASDLLLCHGMYACICMC
jgi:hypothetical protein